jgi:hypothetical protein
VPDDAQPWWHQPAPPPQAPAPRPPTTPDVGLDATLPQYPFLAPPRSSGELGRLGRYRVLKELGRGGMGIVFAADDPALHRTVALKVLLPEAACKPNARERFLRETRAIAQLEHDHIIAVHEVNEDRGVPYLTMPLLRGLSLEDFLKKGRRLTLPQALRVGREVARALAAAHARGLVHRDIKPANLWLDAAKQGRVKVLDFGLARPAGGEDALTGLGAVVGTPAFMSPEQARGEVDHRSDIYSLGAVLYRLLTGRLPVPGNTAYHILANLGTVAPKPVRELAPDVPAAFADLVMRLLAKLPEDRPQSAQEVAEAIRAVERELSAARASATIPVATAVPGAAVTSSGEMDTVESMLTEAQLAPPGRRGPRLLPFLVALALAAAVVGSLFLLPRRDRPPEGPPTGPTADATPGSVALPDDAPPGARVAVERDGREVFTLHDACRRVTLPPGAYRLRLAGGGLLALEDENALVGPGAEAMVRLRQVPVGRLRLTTPLPQVLTGQVRALAFLPDGRALAALGPKRAQLYGLGPADKRDRHHWSPSDTSTYVALAVAPKGGGVALALSNGPVQVWKVEAGPPSRSVVLNQNGEHGKDKPVNALAFSPDGLTLASGGNTNGVLLWDVSAYCGPGAWRPPAR